MFHLAINLLLTYFIFIIYYLDTTLIPFTPSDLRSQINPTRSNPATSSQDLAKFS